MKKSSPIVLKIGGSVITDKDGQLAAKTQEIDRIANEIKRANISNLILVHGGGSFGHPSADEYKIKEGFKENTQKLGFAETHHMMTVLNGLVMDCLLWQELPAVSITPSSCIITEDGRIREFDDEPLVRAMRMELYPVLYGDAVFDSKIGFTILSGDQLVTALALKYSAERIIIGFDEDGLFETDPKKNKNAKMFEKLSFTELKSLNAHMEKPCGRDVTGAMYGKTTELLPAVEKGIRVTILNASKPNYIYKTLRGETVQGTEIEKD